MIDSIKSETIIENNLIKSHNLNEAIEHQILPLTSNIIEPKRYLDVLTTSQFERKYYNKMPEVDFEIIKKPYTILNENHNEEIIYNKFEKNFDTSN